MLKKNFDCWLNIAFWWEKTSFRQSNGSVKVAETVSLRNRGLNNGMLKHGSADKWWWTLRTHKFSSCSRKRQKVREIVFFLPIEVALDSRLGNYQKVYVLFCINICHWESCVHNGCRVCSQCVVWSWSSKIQQIVCVDMWQRTKLGSTTTRLN